MALSVSSYVHTSRYLAVGTFIFVEVSGDATSCLACPAICLPCVLPDLKRRMFTSTRGEYLRHCRRLGNLYILTLRGGYAANGIVGGFELGGRRSEAAPLSTRSTSVSTYQRHSCDNSSFFHNPPCPCYLLPLLTRRASLCVCLNTVRFRVCNPRCVTTQRMFLCRRCMRPLER